MRRHRVYSVADLGFYEDDAKHWVIVTKRVKAKAYGGVCVGEDYHLHIGSRRAL